MKFYLAAQYERHPEMREIRTRLRDHGHVVTSRWIDQHNGSAPDAAGTLQLNQSPAHYTVFANKDLFDLDVADAMIFFSSGNGSKGRGGRHLELGYALALGKPVYFVGQRENVFHTLPQLQVYSDFEGLLNALRELPSASQTVNEMFEDSPEEADSPAKKQERRYSAREEILDEAKELVTSARNVNYGPPHLNFLQIATMMQTLGYTGPAGRRVEPHDVAVILTCMKLARISWSPEKRDHWADVAGYAACGWECVAQQGLAEKANKA